VLDVDFFCNPCNPDTPIEVSIVDGYNNDNFFFAPVSEISPDFAAQKDVYFSI